MSAISNLMENLVQKKVNELYDHVKSQNSSWLTCDCENCRSDAICYVLNRIKPCYVVSGRGLTHSKNILNDSQVSADIDRIALEGMKLVSAAKRPYHAEKGPADDENPTPYFNFPTFTGTVFDGSTFEPFADAQVTLKLDDRLAKMADPSWSNPCITFKANNGNFSFHVDSIQADKAKENFVFDFIIEVYAPDYEPVQYAFSVPLISDSEKKTDLNSTYSLKIQDMFLFEKDKE